MAWANGDLPSRHLQQTTYRSVTDRQRRSIGLYRTALPAGHQKFTLATDINVFLWGLTTPLGRLPRNHLPGNACQRGTNENTNRLLRQYLPKGTDLSIRCQAMLSAPARQLNKRPQKRWDTKLPRSVSKHVLHRSVETAGHSWFSTSCWNLFGTPAWHVAYEQRSTEKTN
jgi:hypothetical protein